LILELLVEGFGDEYDEDSGEDDGEDEGDEDEMMIKRIWPTFLTSPAQNVAADDRRQNAAEERTTHGDAVHFAQILF